jgi:hypothetical protein
MLLSIICMAACALIDRCQTTDVVCAIVMIFAMLDATYLHLIPVSVSTALIIGAGIWTTFGKGHPTKHRARLSLRMFHGACFIIMGVLVFQHSTLMRLSGEICTASEIALDIPLQQPHALTTLGAMALFATGVVLSAGMFIENRRGHEVQRWLTALEPTFMGLSLVLMLL